MCVVIPASLVDEIAEEAFEMTAFEDFVAQQVAKGHGNLRPLPPTAEQTMVEFAAWRKIKGR